jgi:hypothetical protein
MLGRIFMPITKALVKNDKIDDFSYENLFYDFQDLVHFKISIIESLENVRHYEFQLEIDLY